MTTDTIRKAPPLRLSTSAPADQHELTLAQIRRDGGTQARAGNNETVLEEYTAAMREERWTWHAGNRLIVFHDGTDYWLGDGFHRAESASRAGLPSVPCEVRQGNRREAVLFACGANDSHGLRRTRDDVRRAIEILLRDEEWGQWSSREIGRRVGCSDVTVSTVRRELESTAQIKQLTERMGADGKTRSLPAAPAAPIYDDSPLTDEELHDLSLLGGLELHGASTSSMGLPQITLMNARDDWGYKETRSPGGWRIELDQMRKIEESKAQAKAEIAKKEERRVASALPNLPAGWVWRSRNDGLLQAHQTNGPGLTTCYQPDQAAACVEEVGRFIVHAGHASFVQSPPATTAPPAPAVRPLTTAKLADLYTAPAPNATTNATTRVERGVLTQHAEATLAGLVEKLSGSDLRLLYFLMMGEGELLNDEEVAGDIRFEGKKMLDKTLLGELHWIVEGVLQNAGL